MEGLSGPKVRWCSRDRFARGCEVWISIRDLFFCDKIVIHADWGIPLHSSCRPLDPNPNTTSAAPKNSRGRFNVVPFDNRR